MRGGCTLGACNFGAEACVNVTIKPPSKLPLDAQCKKCLSDLSFDEQHLGSAPLELIRNIVCSQESMLSNQLLLFNSLGNLLFLPA